jgi:glucosamine--fructose-6-phosphate aminotransferase (isomerizing)
MCGIVGYLGPLDPKDVILSGLRKLEYRGYDSAGVAILHNGKTKRIRALGKLKALEEKLKDETFVGSMGIGHTRWATHGVPSERNAHPHEVGGISLVHNGIIENYQEIREQLLSRGANITSDTDSELVAHLISENVLKTKDLLKAVQLTLPLLKGAFSIVTFWQEQPDQFVAFKDGPPLVVGIHPDHVFVASDVQALLQYTKKFVYLEDREVVHLKKGQIKYFSNDGKAIQKEEVELNWSADLVEKQGFAHFMLKEIYEQPRAVAAVLEHHIDRQSEKIRIETLGFGSSQEAYKKMDRVFIVACGTSYYAAMIGKYLLETWARIPVEIDIASEFRYRQPILNEKTLVMTISQSGETADTLAALRLAKASKAMTLSLCNVEKSSIDREADGHLFMRSGPEIGVASTKAFMSSMAVLNVWAMGVARVRESTTVAIEAAHIKNLLAIPSQLEVVLSYDKYFSEAAKELKKFKGFLYMGRGTQYPIAMEGALKLKELAYFHAEGYAAGEMKHGPLALIDENMAVVMLAPTDQWYEKTLSNLEEVRARGGQVISIGTADNHRLKEISRYYLSLPKSSWSTDPMLSVVPLQLMAYHLASELEYDVDQPRNLAKSVTVE